MQLSMSTVATERIRGPEGMIYRPFEGIRLCREAGFRHIDFNFTHAPKEDRPFAGEDWESWVLQVRDMSQECGVTVSQTHAYWFWLKDMTSREHWEWSEEMVRRSLRATAMLNPGAWMVTHPRTVFDAEGCNMQKTLEYNYARCSELGELAAKYGVRIAVENLFPLEEKIAYCTQPEELLELLDRLHDPVFGICWDFGHAHMARLDHLQALDQIGSHLKVTHIHDNKAKGDDHFIPSFGNIPWKAVMAKLKEIGYAGNLNLEVSMYNTIPGLVPAALRFMYEAGSELLRLYGQA